MVLHNNTNIICNITHDTTYQLHNIYPNLIYINKFNYFVYAFILYICIYINVNTSILIEITSGYLY